MKFNICKIFICLLFIGLAFNMQAKVWRVNNIPGVNADFSSVSTAISTATAGDTLYVEGSHISYGAVTLNKPLVIIGTGYFLANNDSTQANPNPSSFGTITISSAAQGSKIYGIYAESSAYNSKTVTISANNITMSGCFIYNAAGSSSSNYYGTALHISSGYNDIVISQCFIYQVRAYTSTSTSYNYDTKAIYLEGNNNNIIIANNIIKHGSKSNVSTIYYYQFAIQMATTSSAVFVNNVIIGAFQAFNSIVMNNIQIIGGYPGVYLTSSSYPNVTKNNIGHSTQFGTDYGNQSNVNMSNVFISGPGNENVDNHYMLKSGSPAIGAGIQGEDCGAYGGSGAYNLSGLPAIPAIFDATVPATSNTSTGVNTNIKAKSH